MAVSFLIYFPIIFSVFQPVLFHQEHSEQVKIVDSIVQKFHQEDRFNGVILLAKKDSILYNTSFGKANFELNVPHTLDSRFRIGSITKTFTSVLILKLIEQGKIGFEDVITDHLPDYPSATGTGITIEHLLVQSSGIPDYLSQPGFMETKSVLKHNINEFPKFFKDLDLNFEPGTDWDYGNSEYYLLGLIIEKVTGLSYECAIQKYILEPAGLDHTGFVTSQVIQKFAQGYIRKPDGIEVASPIHPSVCYSAGMMYSTGSDLYKFIHALYAENRILSEEFTQKMTTQRMAYYGYGVYVGYQVINGKRYTAYLHMGEIHGYAAQVSYFPENGYTLIIMDNTQQSPSRLYFAIVDILPGFSQSEEPITGG